MSYSIWSPEHGGRVGVENICEQINSTPQQRFRGKRTSAPSAQKRRPPLRGFCGDQSFLNLLRTTSSDYYSTRPHQAPGSPGLRHMTRNGQGDFSTTTPQKRIGRPFCQLEFRFPGIEMPLKASLITNAEPTFLLKSKGTNIGLFDRDQSNEYSQTTLSIFSESYKECACSLHRSIQPSERSSSQSSLLNIPSASAYVREVSRNINPFSAKWTSLQHCQSFEICHLIGLSLGGEHSGENVVIGSRILNQHLMKPFEQCLLEIIHEWRRENRDECIELTVTADLIPFSEDGGYTHIASKIIYQIKCQERLLTVHFDALSQVIPDRDFKAMIREIVKVLLVSSDQEALEARLRGQEGVRIERGCGISKVVGGLFGRLRPENIDQPLSPTTGRDLSVQW